MDDQASLRRHSFNDRASEYRLARPPYPPRVYELLTDRCRLGIGTRVLEVGAGTGLATGELLSRGARVVAVEPGPDLADHLLDDLGRGSLQVVCSDFETASVSTSDFDLAVSATAFHWVRRDVALPKLATLLRPEGWLAVWWNVFGDPQRPTEFRNALTTLYDRHLPHERRDPTDVPGPLRTESWATELEAGGWFTVEEVELIRWEHQLTAPGARRLFGSFPNINELPSAQRAAFLNDIGTLVDDFGGQVADPYVTAIYLARPQRP